MPANLPAGSIPLCLVSAKEPGRLFYSRPFRTAVICKTAKSGCGVSPQIPPPPGQPPPSPNGSPLIPSSGESMDLENGLNSPAPQAGLRPLAQGVRKAFAAGAVGQ